MQSTSNSFLLVLKKYFLRKHDDWKFWIGLAVVFKSAIFFLQLSQFNATEIPGFIGAMGGDTNSYLTPVENLIVGGTYAPDYRMPGYAFLYFPLLMIFQKATACNIMIILQVFMASASVYLLSLTARRCFKSDALFYLVFYLYAVSSYANLFDAFLLTDSFCTSALIFSAYFFSQFTERRLSRYLVASGLFLTWSVFLRPVYLPLLLFYCVVLLYEALIVKRSKASVVRNVAIFIIPFALTESAWMVRNYIVYKKLVPLTQSFYYPEAEKTYTIELIDFVKAWGGDRTWWNPNAEIRWFGLVESQEGRTSPLETNATLPENIFTSRFNIDSLRMIKNYIQKINEKETPADVANAYTTLVKTKLNAYTLSVKEEKPFLYYIEAPILLLKKFFVHSGTYNLFNRPFRELSYLELLVKIFYSMIYAGTIVFGVAGIFWMGIRKTIEPLAVFIVALCLYSILLFPFVLRQIEFRYFVPAYPFMTMIACYFLLTLGRILKGRFSKYLFK